MSESLMYEKVNGSEDDLSIPGLRDTYGGKHPAWRNLKASAFSKSSLLVNVLKALVVTIALLGFVSMSFQAYRYRDEHRVINCDCGASVAEAKARGCKFEIMSVSWLPDECRDDELDLEFRQEAERGHWQYYADPYKNKTLTYEEVGELGGTMLPFYSQWDWHLAHCFYRWEKHIRWRNRMMNIAVNDAIEHIGHCRKVAYWDHDELIHSGVSVNGSLFS